MVLSTYLKFKSTLGSTSCGTFYSSMEKAGGGASSGSKTVRMSPLEFTIEVDNAVRRCLSDGEYFYFTNTYLEPDGKFAREVIETLGAQRVKDLRRDISVAVGNEFLRYELFPLSKYFAPIEGIHG